MLFPAMRRVKEQYVGWSEVWYPFEIDSEESVA